MVYRSIFFPGSLYLCIVLYSVILEGTTKLHVLAKTALIQGRSMVTVFKHNKAHKSGGGIGFLECLNLPSKIEVLVN